jgi:large conductance mechanosensitive channel
MFADFRSFLHKNNVVALAVGFIMGAAVGKLVSAFVNDLIMPIVGILTPGGDWRKLVFEIGGSKFLIGDFLGSALDFVVIAFVVYLMAKAFRQDAALKA